MFGKKNWPEQATKNVQNGYKKFFDDFMESAKKEGVDDVFQGSQGELFKEILKEFGEMAYAQGATIVAEQLAERMGMKMNHD